MKINKNKKGFTLTELIIVIVIIGILAAVLIPSLSSYIKKAKVSKGVQNARNLTTVLTGEVLFNDKEFLIPSEVVKIAKENGYTLESEADGYAYWYDSEKNAVVFEKMTDVVSAASLTSRSRIESLSESHPNWFYIDQTDNAIKETIETVNDLINIALKHNNIIASSETVLTNDDKSKVLDTMDEKIKELVSKLKEMKLDTKIKSDIVDYVDSFNTQDTIYYNDYGWFNKQLLNNYGTSNEIFVQRALVLDKTENLPEEGSGYESIQVNVEAPLLIPDTISKLPEKFLRTFVSGTIVASANTNINTAYLNENVKLASLASIDRINYIQFSIEPNYLNQEYRFQNGHIFKIPSTSTLELGRSGELIIKTDNVLEYYDYDETSGKALTFEDVYVDLPSTPEYVENKVEEYLLSVSKVPTIKVTEEIMKQKLNIDNFFDRFISANGTVGKISIRSTVEPFSVRYTGIMVDENLIGYKIENVGYITDAILNTVQQTTDESGKVTKDGNNTALITCDIPDAAKNFVNFKNVKVNVELIPQSVEYQNFSPIADKDIVLRIPTGRVYENTNNIITRDLFGDTVNGFALNITDLSQYDWSNDNSTYDCNQVRVSKLTITDNSGNVLFVRYYK